MTPAIAESMDRTCRVDAPFNWSPDDVSARAAHWRTPMTQTADPQTRARMNRRAFLKSGTLAAAGFAATMGPLHVLGLRGARPQPARAATHPGYGPLVNKGDLWLPNEFHYEVISWQGKPMSDGNLTPGIFDGMAAYPGPRG